MAANIPQMAANGQMAMLQQQQPQQQQQQQPQQSKQLQTIVQTNLMHSARLAPPNSWQSRVNIRDRFLGTMNLVTNTILAHQGATEWQKSAMNAIEHEKNLFLQSPDQQSYNQAMAQKITELHQLRQENATELQNHVNNDAARQAQLRAVQRQHQQMMMNQMAMRGLGQPPQHGFQAMQNPMQVPVMPQQSQQLGMGMPTPGMLQNRQDQRQFPMQMGQVRQPGVPQIDPLAQLSQPDKLRVNTLALRLLENADEPTKISARHQIQQRMSHAQLQEFMANKRDPALIYFQHRALMILRNQAQNMTQQRPGMPPNLMRQGPNQGLVNPGLMGNLPRQQAIPDGQAFPPNMEDIRNEQQMGLMAQQAGQTVVPASTAPGRNATQAMTGMAQQGRPGNQQGQNQTPRPAQVQPFGMPDSTAAQIQAQQGVRAVPGRPMPGQPGAMATPTGPPQASQSPAMNTLNAPMPQPPIAIGQGNGGQHMGQGNPPVAAALNPQFSHQNNTRPPSLQGNVANPAMAGMGPNLGPDGAMRNFYAQLQQDRPGANAFQGPRPGLVPGISGPSSAGPIGGPNQAGVDASQKTNGQVQPTMQPGLGQQPKPGLGEIDPRLHAFLQTPQGREAMNNMDVPQHVLHQLRSIIPPETRKWSQLRQYLSNHPINPQAVARLHAYQVMQFKQMWEKRQQQAVAAMAAQGPGGTLGQQPGIQQQQLNPGMPPSVMQVTRQDIEVFRRNPQFANMPDHMLIELVKKFKREAWLRKMQGGQQQPRANVSLAGGVQNPGALMAQAPAGQQGAVSAAPMVIPQQTTQPPQPKPAAAPASEAPTGPAAPAAATKDGRQQPPNPSPGSVAKSLKRPNPETANDVAGQPGGATQRPAPQSEARPPSAAAMPTVEQLAKLPPEQLAKIPQEQRARLPPEHQRVIAMRLAAHEKLAAQLRELASEGRRLAEDEARQQGARITASSPMYSEICSKVLQIAEKIKSFTRTFIMRWYGYTKDDSRARMFFKIRCNISRQFVDGEQMSQLSESLTITKDELDQCANMLESMAQDWETLRRSAGQSRAGAGAQLPSQPSPLSAANLEKQNQALKQVQNRTAAKAGQPPAAPTTSQPPFQLGVQKSSPAGNPEYLSEQRITQANLVIPPARKKAKTGAGQASPSAGQQQTPNAPSPQVSTPSPAVSRKPEPPKLMCPEPGCEMGSIGFPTEEALNAHRQEEHVKPFENPHGFLQEQMTAALGLDAQGNPKASPKQAAQGISTPAATPMSISRSKQGGQKPAATPMSRAGSMQRQGSAAGGKPADMAGTPGRNSGAKQGGGAGTPQIPAAEDLWAGSTVDPQDLFSGIGPSIDAVTGTLVPDFGTYRSLTPNDTPESSKDSGTSETTSDIAETAALDIDLHMQPLDNDLIYNMTNINVENFGSPSMELDMDLFTNDSMMFPLDDLQNDFSKPFRVDRELYSTETEA
ncbi:hypothetical protein VTH82DRAFT_648 [Thermothelomyces myriococcoides]